MTENDAIQRIYAILDTTRHVMRLTGKNAEACHIAIKALEKQIPKKPFLEGDGYADGKTVYDTWRCPNCDADYEIEFDDYEYCPKCGQRIDRRMSTEKRDCHYCQYAITQSEQSSVDCYADDECHFDHHVTDSMEAETCDCFEFCDIFPKN